MKKTHVFFLLLGVLAGLSASNVQYNERVANFVELKQKMDNGDHVKILYLGGSITEGAFCYPISGINKDGVAYDYSSMSNSEVYSWRALTYSWLETNYEKQDEQFTMVTAAVGATHSELATYQLEENVLTYNPDLIFVEFAINDGGKGYISNDTTADKSIYRTMSSIVRRLEAANPDIAICIPISTSRNYTEGFDLSHSHHISFANQMRIPYVDIHDVYFNQTLSEGITTDNVFDGIDDAGNDVHPSPLGHQAYAEGVERTLAKLLAGEGFAFEGDTHGYYTDYPENPIFYSPEQLTTQVGWTTEVSSEYTNSNHVLKGKEVLSPLKEDAQFTISFKGKSVLIWSEYHFSQGDRCGDLEVYVDGKLLKTFTSASSPSTGQEVMMRLMPVVDNLDETKMHTLTLVPKKDANGVMRLGFYAICIDGSQVQGTGPLALNDTMYIFKSNGSVLQVPLAQVDSVGFEYSDGLILDADGNIYSDVEIGTQTWLNKSLMTTHFNNGDPITNITDDTQWSGKASIEPIMGFYQNSPEPWGGYYNSLVVLDERGVCPSGYHIASKEEYETLVAYLGGGTNGNIAAPKLKSATNWDPAMVGTNESGFNAPASSLRDVDGVFKYQNLITFIWTSTLFDGGLKMMYTFVLDNYGNAVFQNDGLINKGHPIRCVKD